MVGARWAEAEGNWHVTIKRPKAGKSTSDSTAEDFEVFEDTADLLFTGMGGLSRWSWPDIEGLKTFKGLMVHSAKWEVPSSADAATGSPQIRKNWEEDVKDWGNKRVAVIGVVRAFVDISCDSLMTPFRHIGLVGTSDRSCFTAQGWQGA